jgi:hypothetical protein
MAGKVTYYEGGEISREGKRWCAVYYPRKVMFFPTRELAEAWLAGMIAKFGVRAEREIRVKGKTEPFRGVGIFG